MQRIFYVIFVVLVFILGMAGCSPATTATPIPPITLDLSDTSELNQVRASAEVVPSQEARLSFSISGLVKEITVEKGDQVQAGQELAVLNTSELEYEMIAAEAALTSAEIDAQMQRQRRRKFDFDTFNFIYVSPPGEKILIADSKVEQMRFALEIVKASIVQGTLIAPFSGTVVEINVSPGEFIQPAQVVIVLVALDSLQIETTDLSELNVAAVEIGQPASVYVEALGEEFPGKVTAISPISETIGGDVVYPVTIKLDEQPVDLLWGMSADVEINIE